MTSVDQVVTGATEITRQASELGGSNFLATLVLLGVFALAAAHLWFVDIPNGQAYRNSLAAKDQILLGIDAKLARLLGAMGFGVGALTKVSKQIPNLDITEELGQMRGALTSGGVP